MPLSRRQFLPLLLLPALLTACAGSDSAASSGGGASAAPSAAAAQFPLTVTHRYGSTTVEAEPQRVVSVGFTDQDALLALGVVPVGIRDWYGDQPQAVWPWARDALGDAEPEVLSAAEINVEAVAALRPDLIVGISSGMTKADYDKLSALAPTVAQPEGVLFGTSWQDLTTLVGSALGRPDRAEELVTEVEERFSAVRSAHPEFADNTAVFGALGEGGTVYAYGPDDIRGRILTGLGFRIPEPVVEAAGDLFYATVSTERLDVVDAGAVIWLSSDPALVTDLKASAVYKNLTAAKEGRDIDLSDPVLGGAASFGSVLSLPVIIDALVPRLAAAVDGDPATATS